MISVIVPVYNAEAFLEPCIKSVLTQSGQAVELILVNDGSTDDSLRLCRRWETDSRVTVLSTENRGVSAARNSGLEIASGEWIMFLDSDDYLLPGCLAQLMQMVQPDTQEVLAAYTRSETASRAPLWETVAAAHVRTMTLDPINHQLLPEFYELLPLSLPSSCAKLYRRDLIRKNGIRFREGLRLSEDTLFNLDYLSCIDRVVVTDLPVFFYRQNTSSVTCVFKPEHLSNRFCFFDILTQRKEPHAPVHILSMLFAEAARIERCALGDERRLLENQITDYLSRNPQLLSFAKDRSLSTGKWQRMVYRAAALCFSRRAYRAGFAVLRAYASITQG
jgi:glycosyltransferase involved in cell wall biosynthesis